MECGDQVSGILRRPTAHESHNGCAGPLGIHGARPGNHTASKGDELAPSLDRLPVDEDTLPTYQFSHGRAGVCRSAVDTCDGGAWVEPRTIASDHGCSSGLYG